MNTTTSFDFDQEFPASVEKIDFSADGFAHTQTTKFFVFSIIENMVSAEAKYAEATSEARRQQQKLIASLKKMNTRALVRKFTKVFGCEPFNPFDRQEMITDLAAKLNEDIAIPSNPAMRRRAFEQVVGIQRSNGHNGKISDSTVRLIRAMREDGEKYKDISAATGVSPNMCCAIATGLSYKHVN